MQIQMVHSISGIDGFAATIALVGYLVVFIALVMLYLIFARMPSLISSVTVLISGKREKPAKKGQVQNITGEINAAIAMALYLYMNELHDMESRKLTIKKVSKRYSPWSSKIYGLRRLPRY